MRWIQSALAVLGVTLVSPALADFPERPIKMIVPWAAGGDTDNIFRPFVPHLQKHIGQTVVIANIGGASGTVGAREARNSPPDGFTTRAAQLLARPRRPADIRRAYQAAAKISECAAASPPMQS